MTLLSKKKIGSGSDAVSVVICLADDLRIFPDHNYAINNVRPKLLDLKDPSLDLAYGDVVENPVLYTCSPGKVEKSLRSEMICTLARSQSVALNNRKAYVK